MSKIDYLIGNRKELWTCSIMNCRNILKYINSLITIEELKQALELRKVIRLNPYHFVEVKLLFNNELSRSFGCAQD